MTEQEYHLKKMQIARLKNLLMKRFMTLEALEFARATIECEKYDKKKIEANAEKHRKIFE